MRALCIALTTPFLASFRFHGLDKFVSSLAPRILAPSVLPWLAGVPSDVLPLNVSIWLPDVLFVCIFSMSILCGQDITRATILVTTPLVKLLFLT